MRIAFDSNDFIWLVIIICVVGIFSFLLIFSSFFIARVYGAVEESDEINELCLVRCIKYRSGKWVIEVADIFDENAVVLIKYGWIFLNLYSNWEISVITNGMKSGVIRGQIDSNYKLFRKRIRRM